MPGLGVRGNHGRFLSRDRSDIMEAVFKEGGGGQAQGTAAAQTVWRNECAKCPPVLLRTGRTESCSQAVNCSHSRRKHPA